MRATVESVAPTSCFRVSGPCSVAVTMVRGLVLLAAMLVLAPGALAADSDGDGVDDATDCRPTDGTTWAISSEARSLHVTGGASTSLSWLAPTPAPGTTVYDVLRSNGSQSFASAVCLLSNTSATSAPNLDLTTPSNVYFYLVRSKTACGGALGVNSSGIPITGTSCSVGDGGSCAVSAACTSANCCSTVCRNLQTDVNNCGNCGLACNHTNATATCSAGACGLVCNPGFKNCDGLGSNGCEISTNTDVSNCGNCGVVCNNSNATPTCSSGVCGLNCNTGFLNCDGVGTNGCETNTTNSVNSCGNCSNVCPGQGQTTADAGCASSSCTFTCKGENYDVNNTASDGCEQLDSPTGNHTSGSAVSLGSADCFNTTTVSTVGAVLSDSRIHTNPAVTGFDSITGSAPDFYAVTATGGSFCTNDFSFSLSTSGGTAALCYQLTVQTNATIQTCSATGAGGCSVSFGSGAYTTGSTVLIKVSKTCSSATREHVNWSVSGHL